MYRKLCKCVASILHQRYWSNFNCLNQHRSHGPFFLYSIAARIRSTTRGYVFIGGYPPCLWSFPGPVTSSVQSLVPGPAGVRGTPAKIGGTPSPSQDRKYNETGHESECYTAGGKPIAVTHFLCVIYFHRFLEMGGEFPVLKNHRILWFFLNPGKCRES